MLSEKQMALATRCLWSLQESTLDIGGLLLTFVDGLTVTSTLDGGDSTQRLAAVATTMFLLGEEASELWGRGESLEMYITLRDEDDPRILRTVYMCPVGYQAVMVAVIDVEHVAPPLKAHLHRAATYLQAVLDGATPSLPLWD